MTGAGWRAFLPIVGWLPRYKPAWLRYDLIAALTAWALIVPQAIAYAQIAGLPPHTGLAAAAAGLIAYALLGTSRQLMVSPTSSTAAISAARQRRQRCQCSAETGITHRPRRLADAVPQRGTRSRHDPQHGA